MCDRGRRTVKRTMKECLDDKSGTTLVELIVTFALIGLFMTAATGMLTSSLQMFGRMQATSSAITVSDLILDKVSGEIVAADIPKKTEGSNSGYYFWLEPEVATQEVKSRWVVFRNRSKSPIAIFAAPTTEGGEVDIAGMGKGQLFIRYYAVSKEEQKAVEEIDWHFDSNVYMDYTIERLNFSRENAGEHPNVVRIDLTLRNKKTGFEYSSYRYAENYNYDFKSNYMCARDEIEPGNRAFPLEAKEFEIKPSEGGGGGGEPEKPEEPDTPEEARAKLTVIHQVTDGNASIYSGKVLKTEHLTEKDSNGYNEWWPYIPAKQLEGAEIDGFEFVRSVNQNTEETGGGYWNVKVEESEAITVIFYYKPKETIYCITAYEWGTESKPYEFKKMFSKASGVHKQKMIIEAPATLFDYTDWSGTVTYQLVDDSGKAVDTFSRTQTLEFNYTYNNDNVVSSTDNNFKFYYRKKNIPYEIQYRCEDKEIREADKGMGILGQEIVAPEHTIAGYRRVDSMVQSMTLTENAEENLLIIRYISIGSNAPFHPVGSDIVIVIEAKNHREPTDMEKRIAQDIFRFFNEGWSNIEVSGTEYLTGAYKIFELDGEKYAVAGGTNRDKFEDSLRAELMKKEGVGEGNIIEIKKDDISSEAKRKVFLEYILKNAGASEEYIKEIHDIDIEFDKDDNPKRLEEVSFKNKQGEEIKIEYR